MRKFFVILLLLATAQLAMAQIKLQLSLLSDNQTYMVSMISDATLVYPKNITGTAQVTLRFPKKDRLGIVNFKNLIPNVVWHDNAYLEADQNSHEMNFVSFGLKSQGTTAIPYQAGQEVPLFTFRNYYGCISSLELVENQGDNLSSDEAKTFNIGNHWTTVANQKEAYKGNIHATVKCPETKKQQNMVATDRLFTSLMAYPVPASNNLTLRLNAEKKEALTANKVVIVDALGKEVLRQKIVIKEGDQELTIDIDALDSGVYFFQIKGEQVYSKNYKFVVIDNN